MNNTIDVFILLVKSRRTRSKLFSNIPTKINLKNQFPRIKYLQQHRDIFMQNQVNATPKYIPNTVKVGLKTANFPLYRKNALLLTKVEERRKKLPSLFIILFSRG